MGDTIASRSVNLAVMRGAQPVETGGDRAMFDSEFGKAVETKLQGLYEATWDLLQDNRHEVLSIAHALEAHKTITGDDVAAVIEGRQGALVDGRPYADPRFARELEEYHAAAVSAHEEHGGVEGQLPIPVPPSPLAMLPQPAHAPGAAPVRRDPPS
jgi:cell division protease FtsH